MDINEKSQLLGICLWLKQQPEYKIYNKTNENNICYHVAPLTYAKLIYRYNNERKKLEVFDEHDWAHLHDCVYHVTKQKSTHDELINIFNSLSEDLRECAYEYGMSDTVWRDNFIDWYSEKIK